MNDASREVLIQKGAAVEHLGRKALIVRILGVDSVLIADSETNEIQHAKIAALRPVTRRPVATGVPDLTEIPEKPWEEAQMRKSIIAPLLKKSDRTLSDVAARARKFNLHPSTLYNWMAAYEENPQVTSLLRERRSDKGSSRLSPEIEAIVTHVIENEYLSQQRKSIKDTLRIVTRQCEIAGLPAPHYNTLRRRIEHISAERKIARRRGRRAAEEKYTPIRGSFPGADWPLSVVQIDHTLLDIIPVDDVHRAYITRPWITLAFDVFSRMVLGYYVSLDPPGNLGTGLCITNAILPKEELLSKYGVEGKWPCWGKPAALHADNAGEFRGKMLRQACLQHGIDLIWRPVKKPQYGAHIERFLGTLAKAIHALPGTTFSRLDKRDEYKSEQKASLTLADLDEWLVNRIMAYHSEKHSALGVAPLQRFEEGIFRGTALHAATGLPPRITEITAKDRLRLDLTPFVERTIQRDGVSINGIPYYHDVLRRWVNAEDPDHPELKRKFKFRWDPRNMSTIWFYDPELKEYFAVPYRNTSFPALSIWELRKVKAHLTKEGVKSRDIDERYIKERYERMREIEARAAGKTKAARRAEQRRQGWANAHKPQLQTQRPASDSPVPAKDFEVLPPFEDYE